MIISHKYKFIFIHVSKCGGTSITQALLPYLGDNDVVLGVSKPEASSYFARKVIRSVSYARNVLPYLYQKYWDDSTEINIGFKSYVSRMAETRTHNGIQINKHSTSSEIRNFVESRLWNEYFKFSFVRNPWDRAVSTYYWFHRYNWKDARGNADKVRELPDFTSFVKSNFLYFIKSSTSMIFDDDNRNIVDYVGRFESIEQDFSEVCNRLGLTHLQLPKTNATGRARDYRTYYDSESEEIIQKKYKSDIDNFSYQFQ